ncbi:formate/nitrite transporter family protein [Paenibacillus polysaccharolyticus]|uniref:Formate/nitrite transporter family protein n=1 Tax=Paenibacillus cucumis (ex Kampfer et al. 2016) TaxID=1776858 RepID=A0ABS7KJF2_9BACL|nr:MULTISPECIES: formate/nitrite transporter family protein [Paenibacillus]MDP9699305.1 nitrite transporter NirC [Paenibacillus intestini]MBY0204239.1 formate/nitrite transporter family protein [Paenibacillus cucumis (ex Kampfer et al. 2016)]MCM3133944.1 formate/nitrite transporter family protein [Paenibacillus polysaccharolyticus]MCP1132567.1 formate/nitrite transporter family protein [Paenibacillus polysaccharolyticus]MDT0124132.1 formate/nitrite transporter family protein [Paenibacillus sp.
MYTPSVEGIIEAAVKKRDQMNASLPRYMVAALMAGAYVGLGIILIFSIGAPLLAAHSPLQTMLMGMSFGLALTLVIFAGSELFTGNNMFFTMSTLAGRTTVNDTLKNWGLVFLGNLIGAVLLSLLIVGSGLFKAATPEHLLFVVSAKKMSAPVTELFFRGILCNWLVCLAIWMSARSKEDIAKLVLIWWCLYAFIASGYEHSVANMTLLSLAWLLPNHPDTISLAGWFHNMIPVTLGNIIGGALFVGMAYWYTSPVRKKA